MKKILSTALVLLLGAALIGCNTTPTQDGAVLGGALGAATGAVIGHQSGKQGEGALIGAGAGALAGALIGDQVDEQRRAQPVRAIEPTAHRVQRGHYETRVVTSPTGEKYEERVWVPAR
jgi:uncharacterized protein YcfJ